MRISRDEVRDYANTFCLGLCKGFTQGGSNADNVFADAHLKIGGSEIDWDPAYEAVKKDAEEEPYDWCCEGRGGLDSWKSLHYIPVQDFDYKVSLVLLRIYDWH